MSQKERQRPHLLKMVLEGKNTLKDAGKRMGAIYRHAKRLKKRFISEGAKGLVHGNRGRPSVKALNHELANRIIELSQSMNDFSLSAAISYLTLSISSLNLHFVATKM